MENRSLDNVTPEVRSRMMSRVLARDTGPERIVRSVAQRLGLRFRLHRADLPGRPDLVFPRYRTVVFVHGCFWHRHADCHLTTTPKSRAEFWLAKFAANVDRDRRVSEALADAGWRVLLVWECETREPAGLRNRLAREFALATDSARAPSAAGDVGPR